MSGIATAVVVTGAVSAYASSQAAGSAADSQNAATAAGSRAAANELAFAKEQQDNWDEVFGPTQEILAEYHNNLDPRVEGNKQVIEGVQNLQKGYQEYQTQLDVNLSQRGMSQSGLGAELTSQAMYQNEMGKAQHTTDVRNNIEQDIAGQQMNFLGLGMGIQPSINAGVQSAYGSQQSTANNQFNAATSQLNQANASFAGAISGIGTGLGYFLPGSSSVPSTSTVGGYDVSHAGYAPYA